MPMLIVDGSCLNVLENFSADSLILETFFTSLWNASPNNWQLSDFNKFWWSFKWRLADLKSAVAVITATPLSYVIWVFNGLPQQNYTCIQVLNTFFRVQILLVNFVCSDISLDLFPNFCKETQDYWNNCLWILANSSFTLTVLWFPLYSRRGLNSSSFVGWTIDNFAGRGMFWKLLQFFWCKVLTLSSKSVANSSGKCYLFCFWFIERRQKRFAGSFSVFSSSFFLLIPISPVL